jgi:hypothetical protein
LEILPEDVAILPARIKLPFTRRKLFPILEAGLSKLAAVLLLHRKGFPVLDAVDWEQCTPSRGTSPLDGFIDFFFSGASEIKLDAVHRKLSATRTMFPARFISWADRG